MKMIGVIYLFNLGKINETSTRLIIARRLERSKR
jgi:hypothetical protein